MKKYYLLFFFFINLIYYSKSNAQPPPGCNVFTVIDNDNDGFGVFDIDWYLHVAVPEDAALSGYDLSGYTLVLYPSEMDYNNSTDAITSATYISLSPHQDTFIQFIYSGSGPQYDALDLTFRFSCHYLDTILPGGDADADGILNSNEDLNGNLNLNDDDSDLDGVPNYLDTDPPLASNAFNTDSFAITPNPASGIINLYLGKWNGKYSLAIYDAAGKSVLELKNSIAKSINVSQLNSGIYLVNIKINDQQIVRKLVIQ